MRPDNHTLIPVLRQKLSGLIWKIKVGAEHSLIAVESRSTHDRQAAFSVMDFSSGELHFKERTYDEEWNLGLAYLTKDNIVLNVFQKSDIPEARGIISADTISGEIIWQRYDIALDLATSQGIRIYDPRMQPRRYSWIDHLTAGSISAPAETKDTLPGLLLPTSLDLTALPGFISRERVTGLVQGLNYAGKTLVSFHELNDSYIQQRMIVYQDDNVLLDDILISDIQKMQPEAFFIHQNHLIYIRNKKELISYLL